LIMEWYRERCVPVGALGMWRAVQKLIHGEILLYYCYIVVYGGGEDYELSGIYSFRPYEVLRCKLHRRA